MHWLYLFGLFTCRLFCSSLFIGLRSYSCYLDRLVCRSGLLKQETRAHRTYLIFYPFPCLNQYMILHSEEWISTAIMINMIVNSPTPLGVTLYPLQITQLSSFLAFTLSHRRVDVCNLETSVSMRLYHW